MLSIDWFIGMARAAGNLIGNCVATEVVADKVVELDTEQAQRVLNKSARIRDVIRG